MLSFTKIKSNRKLFWFICLVIVYSFLFHHPVKHALLMASKLSQQTPEAAVVGSGLPDCQSSVDFLIFKDLAKSGGLLHKIDDFINAMQLAVRTNRTLVDFAPGLRHFHNHDVEGQRRKDVVQAWELFWKFGHFFDLENIFYEVKTEQVPHLCKFRFMTVEEHQKLATTGEVQNTLVLEFGENPKSLPPNASRGRILKNFLSGAKTTELNSMALHVQPAFRGKPPFGPFFQTAARNIKEECLTQIQGDLVGQNGRQPKFYVVQLRGTDRPAILSLGVDYVIKRIESFGITQQDNLYFMTDLSSTHGYVRGIKSHFGSAMCQAKDMTLFQQLPFRRNNYIVFAAELALQKISDGFIMTYETHKQFAEQNEMGYLLAQSKLQKMKRENNGQNFETVY